MDHSDDIYEIRCSPLSRSATRVYVARTYLSICLSVYLSICLSVYLSICLSICLSNTQRVGRCPYPPGRVQGATCATHVSCRERGDAGDAGERERERERERETHTQQSTIMIITHVNTNTIMQTVCVWNR